MAQSELEACNSALIKLGARKTLTGVSASGTTQEERVCATRVDLVKKTILSAHPWNCATERVYLEPTWSTITGAAGDGSSDNEVRITSASHGLSTGMRVTIRDVGGTQEANGTWRVTVISSSTFDLQDSTFSTTYTSGGEWTRAAAFDYNYSIALPSDCLRVLGANEKWNEPEYVIEKGRILTSDASLNLRYISNISDYTVFSIFFYEALICLLAWDIARELGRDENMKQALWEEFKMALRKAQNTDSTEDSTKYLEQNQWVKSRLSNQAVESNIWLGN